MNRLFADTSYYLALLNPRDAWHQRACELSRLLDADVVITDYVLLELGNAFSSVSLRQRLRPMIELLRADSAIECVPANEELFERGLTLFGQRPDKEWSLTDCISFVVMQDYGLTDALTTDHHFEQAGFNALLSSQSRSD